MRESALLKISEHPVEVVAPLVAELIIDDSSEVTQATCLDLLERMGAAVSLAEIRAEGWLDQIGERIERFDQICEIMGQRFLAYSVILGIQIRSISLDPKFHANTSIEFTVDNAVQTLPLIEFQTQVVQAIMRTRQGCVDIELPLTVEQADAVVGGHTLLLAPLFDITIEHLVVSDTGPGDPDFLIGYISPDGFNFVPLKKFDELLKGKVRRDLAGLAEEPFKLQLGDADKAKEAFERDDFDAVIEILESWPGLLSVLNRTPMAKKLESEKREKIGAGLELLGASFERRGRSDWSEELYKLGLQFIKEGNVAARLFKRLSRLIVGMERYSEAIGLIRRAIQLGVPDTELKVALALSYIHTNKAVAARALLQNLVESGLESPDLKMCMSEARSRFASAGLEWNVPSV